jgi:Zn-dependent metalloprotease
MTFAIHISKAGADRAPQQRAMALGVALAVALLALPAAAAAPVHARQLAERALGQLGAPGNWRIDQQLVNAQGRTVVHASQLHHGHRVWGSRAIIHADAKGAPTLLGGATDAPQPNGTPALNKDQAVAIAASALGLKGRSLAPRVELVVFPTRHHGGLRLARDAGGSLQLDRKLSVVTARPRAAHVWAYEVKLAAHNRQDGLKAMSYVIDAQTGAVMHVADEVRLLAPPNAPAQRDTDVAVKGIGFSQYSGQVVLDTTRRADGSYQMIDRTRGKKFVPFLNDGIQDPYGNPVFDEDGQPIAIIGLQALGERHEGFNWDFTANWYWYAQNTSNSWGDGKQFVGYPFGSETTPNGQTAAVDAHYGMATSWDFYKNIFGREGVDGEGGSLVSIAHSFSYFGFPDDFAVYSADFGVLLGDGSRSARTNPQTGLMIPPNPDGRGSMTTLDIVGHELTHGVIDHSAGLVNFGEAGALSEATGDIFGVLIKAYARRASGTDSVIPASGVVWNLAEQNGLKPIRDMRQPSAIGYGRENWYAGLEYMDISYAAGVINRCFYFLSQGAASSAGNGDYSPYLPGGMSGIGNDRAARIWYKALTEYMTPLTTFAEAREAAIKAAADLYGAGSADVIAVRRAFAAVNIGSADSSTPVRINLALVHPAGSMFNPDGAEDFGSGTSRMPIVAMSTPVSLKAQVDNTDDKRVEWKLGTIPGSRNNPGFQHNGGIMTADGVWTPDRDWGFHALNVTSLADPRQYAEGVAWVIDGDADSDTEFDAMDLGAVALSWGMNTPVKFSHAVVHDYVVSSFDVAALVEAFVNSFGGSAG